MDENSECRVSNTDSVVNTAVSEFNMQAVSNGKQSLTRRSRAAEICGLNTPLG